MNFSPLNDPEFQNYREEAHKAAAKKRRIRTLVILLATALLSLAAVALLVMTAADAVHNVKLDENSPQILLWVAGLFGRGVQETLPPLPSRPDEPETPTPVAPPVTPTLPDTPDPATPSEVSTPTPPPGVTHVTTIYVDPGHGFLSPSGTAMDVGASGYYTSISGENGKKLYEADLTLAIGLKLKEKLTALGYDVILSRESYVNEALPINERARRVNQTDADVFISIHANFFSNESVYGARVFYCDRRSDSTECRNYASAVAAAIDAAGASRKTTTLHVDNSLAMINSTKIPAVLVETCFLTNEEDARAALTEEWQDQMAGALCQAINGMYPVKYSFE